MSLHSTGGDENGSNAHTHTHTRELVSYEGEVEGML